MLELTVGICNSTVVLTSRIFSTKTSYSLSWNGTDHQDMLNADYCFGISSLVNNEVEFAAIPISIEFDLVGSAVVIAYSSISVDEKVMFVTNNLLVAIVLRDQWNKTVKKSSKSPISVYDEAGNVIGIASDLTRYNATLKEGQLIATKTLYLGSVNASNPHVSFYGNRILNHRNND